MHGIICEILEVLQTVNPNTDEDGFIHYKDFRISEELVKRYQKPQKIAVSLVEKSSTLKCTLSVKR